MPKFVLPIAFVVLIGGICASVIPYSPSSGLSSEGGGNNEILSIINSKLNLRNINHSIDNDNQISVKDFHTENDANRLRRSTGGLEGYRNCTKQLVGLYYSNPEDTYIQYNGGSCVNVYSDAACTNKRYSSNRYIRYEIELPYIGSVEICSEAPEAPNRARNLKMSVYLLFIPIAALLQFQYA